MAAIAASILVGLSVPQCSLAQIETVPLEKATSTAQPLKKKEVDQVRALGIFVLVSSGVFATSLSLENNNILFPAISKANVALEEYKQQQQDFEKYQKEEEAQQRAQAAAEAGLEESRLKVLGSKEAGPSQPVADPSSSQEAAPTKPVQQQEQVQSVNGKAQESQQSAGKASQDSEGKGKKKEELSASKK